MHGRGQVDGQLERGVAVAVRLPQHAPARADDVHGPHHVRSVHARVVRVGVVAALCKWEAIVCVI